MSPEQARGKELDARTICSRSAQSCTRWRRPRCPFTARSPALIFKAILDSDPPPAMRFNRDIPAKLEDIIKGLGERPQSALPERGRNAKRLQRLKRDTETGRVPAASSGSVPACGQAAHATAAGTQAGKRNLWKIAVPSVAVVLALIAGGLYYRSHRTKPLTDKDTIVLADFDNKTGDPVFDGTLKTALGVSLNQSPFLNVLSDNTVAATLKRMTKPSGTKLTPDLHASFASGRAARLILLGRLPAWAANTCWG
jgi:hypothetical protein